jgi:hypothetical protein
VVSRNVSNSFIMLAEVCSAKEQYYEGSCLYGHPSAAGFKSGSCHRTS